MPATKQLIQNITDDTHARVEELVNKAIHELVFACHNAEHDEPEDALTHVVQAQWNIEAVADLLAKKD